MRPSLLAARVWWPPSARSASRKIERFHGTLRRELLNGGTFPSLAAAQQAIDAWITEYNTDRPHQSIGRCTPAERFVTRAADIGPGRNGTAEDWTRYREELRNPPPRRPSTPPPGYRFITYTDGMGMRHRAAVRDRNA